MPKLPSQFTLFTSNSFHSFCGNTSPQQRCYHKLRVLPYVRLSYRDNMFHDEVPTQRSSLHLDEEYSSRCLKKKEQWAFRWKTLLSIRCLLTAVICGVKQNMHVLMHMNLLNEFFECVACRGVGSHSKYQSCWYSLSDAEDLLQPAFIPDLAKGSLWIYVILRVWYLSDTLYHAFVFFGGCIIYFLFNTLTMCIKHMEN